MDARRVHRQAQSPKRSITSGDPAGGRVGWRDRCSHASTRPRSPARDGGRCGSPRRAAHAGGRRTSEGASRAAWQSARDGGRSAAGDRVCLSGSKARAGETPNEYAARPARRPFTVVRLFHSETVRTPVAGCTTEAVAVGWPRRSQDASGPREGQRPPGMVVQRRIAPTFLQPMMRTRARCEGGRPCRRRIRSPRHSPRLWHPPTSNSSTSWPRI